MLVFSKLNEDPQNLTETDFDSWAIPELLECYKDKIVKLAQFAYGNVYEDAGASVSLRAFNELAAIEIRKALISFYINCQHWRYNRDLNSYLLTCLNRLSNRVKFDANAVKKTVALICPGCKFLGQKEFVQYENRILRCTVCTNEQIRLEDELVILSRKQNKHNEISLVKSELRLRRIFALHSRKGFGCPDCGRFIPESYIDQFGGSCVYNNCGWFGSIKELNKMAYPTTMTVKINLSLDANTSNNNDKKCDKNFHEIISDNNQDNENLIIIQETFNKELHILKETIKSQLHRVETYEKKSIQKHLMYRAFLNLTEIEPIDMVSYLVHLKHFGDSPIQSRIFQEYIRLIENNLPFVVRDHEVFSLQDPVLGIFLGVSKFEAEIDARGIISNNTIETYIGGRKLTDFGPCFIGLLIDVIDNNTGNSIKECVESYSFSSIKMKPDYKYTPVTITHLRISAHYEMGGLVYLQRIRRKIVDSVYFKIHGKKRPLSRGQISEIEKAVY